MSTQPKAPASGKTKPTDPVLEGNPNIGHVPSDKEDLKKTQTDAKPKV